MAGAREPEELTRMFVEHANAGDAAGMAELYEVDAVVAYPPGQMTKGRDAIRELYQAFIRNISRIEPEEPLQTFVTNDLALTSTQRRDGRGIRIQVARRQPDGTWLRVIDWPEPPSGQP